MTLAVQLRGGGTSHISATADNVVVWMLFVAFLAPLLASPILDKAAQEANGVEFLANPSVQAMIAGLDLLTLAVGYTAIRSWATFGERRRLRRLHVESLPEPIRTEMLHCVDPQIRTDRSVDWKWRPADLGVGACMVHRHRPIIVLSRGLCELSRISPQRLRAVVAHEFAHLRNGDTTFVPLLYLFRLLSASLALVLIFAPLAIFKGNNTGDRGDGVEIFATFVGCLLQFLFLDWLSCFLIYRREFFADVGAVNFLPSKIAYLKILLRSGNTTAPFHPSPFDRANAILHGTPVAVRSKAMIALALWLPITALLSLQLALAGLLAAGAAYVVVVEWKKGVQPRIPALAASRVIAAPQSDPVEVSL